MSVVIDRIDQKVEKYENLAKKVHKVIRVSKQSCNVANKACNYVLQCIKALDNLSKFGAAPLGRVAKVLKATKPTFTKAQTLTRNLRVRISKAEKSTDRVKKLVKEIRVRLGVAKRNATVWEKKVDLFVNTTCNKQLSCAERSAELMIAAERKTTKALVDLNNFINKFEVFTKALSPIANAVHQINKKIAAAENVPVFGWFVKIIKTVGSAVNGIIDMVLSAVGFNALLSTLNNAVNPLAPVIRQLEGSIRPLMDAASIFSKEMSVIENFFDTIRCSGGRVPMPPPALEYPKSSKMVPDNLVGTPATGGAWILAKDANSSIYWKLWHTDMLAEKQYPRSWPKEAYMVSGYDGSVWIACKTTGKENYAIWRYDNAGASNEKCLYDNYCMSSKAQMVADHRGGCFILIEKDSNSTRLWHCNTSREKKLCTYAGSDRVKVCADGIGGCWVFCDTKGTTRTFWRLWHANTEGDEQAFWEFPKISRMTTDGQGGLWVLAPTTTSHLDKLWHVSVESEVQTRFIYPKSTKSTDMVTDHRGGVWIMCDTKGEGRTLWHCNDEEEVKYSSFHEDSTICSDGLGGVIVNNIGANSSSSSQGYLEQYGGI